MSKQSDMPIHLKCCLTIKEAAIYSNIGEKQIRNIVKNPEFNYLIIKIGKKTLIKREAFEHFLDNISEVCESEVF